VLDEGDPKPRQDEGRSCGAPDRELHHHDHANLRKEAAAALGEIADPAAEP